jgi:uncharacterized protein (DUF2236 family)
MPTISGMSTPSSRAFSVLPDLRARVAGEVRKLFADPGFHFEPGTDGPTPADSIARTVHADVTVMMIGGYASLLLQMLHPLALAGVWDHSSFRDDMHGRLKRTAQFIAVTTYGGREDAEAIIDRVRRIHERVHGTLPDGTPYAASDPALLEFVHACEAHCFLAAWMRFREPFMPRARQDAYIRDLAPVARALGAESVPETRTALDQYLRTVRPQLRYDARTRDVARRLLGQPASSLTLVPFQALTREAGIGLLPAWARGMHGFEARPTVRPALRTAVSAAAGALGLGMRWAMAPRS